MKKTQLLILAMLAVCLMFQGTALAKLVSGKIVSADAAAKSLSVSFTNPDTGAEEKAEIWINADTAFSGAKALEELKAGQEVDVEAEADEAGKWQAKSVAVAAELGDEAAEEPAEEPAQ